MSLRIGLITGCYKPLINGVTRMVELYQQTLTTAGHEATIFTFGNNQKSQPHVQRAPALPLGQTGYYATPRLPRAMQKQLAQMDILHAHHLFMSVELARRYARPGTPIIYTNHTRYDLYTAAYLRQYLPWLKPSTADKIARRTLRTLWPHQAAHADVVIAPTTAVRDTMRTFGVTTPIVVIPNGIDIAPFAHAVPLPRPAYHLPQDVPLFIYVGRLAREKNLPHLLTAVQRVRDDYNTAVHLWLVGDGPQRADLQHLTAERQLENCVTFAGAVPPHQIPRYLATADLFVTPSVSEVHPLTAIEALAAGLPIVAYDSPGLSDIITHGRVGLLSSPNPAQLADHIHQLATQPDLRHTFSTAARARSQQYDIRHTVAQTVTLYEKMLVR